MKKLKMAFFGTPDFSVPTLDMLASHPAVDLTWVISMPDRKAGRGYQLKSPEVIEYAKEKKIPFFQTENINKEEEFLSKLEQVDVFIVLAFAQFLGQRLLDMPSRGCFNIHTSLLPKYRGAAPIQYALLSGDISTGVSIQKMVKKMDAGDIAWSHPVDISPNETGGQLYTRLKYQAALSTSDFIDALLKNKIEYTQQNESDVSFAPTLKREDGKLDFINKSAGSIKDQVRALFPWPGTYCTLNGKRLKVFRVEILDKTLNPGKVDSSLGELHIGCKEGSIRLAEIQLEGKKPSTDRELLNGIKSEVVIE